MSEKYFKVKNGIITNTINTTSGALSVNANLTLNGSLVATTAIGLASGGTGATTAAGARTNLGLGTIATQDASSVTITGGYTSLPAANYRLASGLSNTYSLPISTGSDSLTQLPMGGVVWHDLLRFLRYYTLTTEVSDDLTTWTSTTNDKRLFSGKEDQVINVISDVGARQGIRWQFYGTSLGWSSAEWLVLGIAYSAVARTYQVVVESSADGITWAQRHISSGSASALPVFFRVNTYSGDNYVRVTVTRTSGTGQINLSSMRLLTSRWGDQGRGKEAEYPYNWDENGNITTLGNVTVSGQGTLSANTVAIAGYGNVINSVGQWVGPNTGLQGTQGIQGIQGTQGIQGIQGRQGITGAQGITGTQGTTGSQGIQGIQGTTGVQGITGTQGTTGAQGIQGIQGTTGAQGITGTQGTTGAQGIQGIQGTAGSQGVQGIQGIQGIQGRQGIQGTQGIQGIQGTLAGSSYTIKTAAYTAVAGDYLIADTTAGTFTITLPATPTAGSMVRIADGNDWATTNLTVGRNTHTIEGLAEDLILNIRGLSIDFVYDGVSNWDIYTTAGAANSIYSLEESSTNAEYYPVFVAGLQSQAASIRTTSTAFSFNPNTCTLTAVDFNATSDINLKNNIQVIPNALAKIKQLDGILFTWKNNDKASVGVIAQQVETIFPELVNTNAAGEKAVNYNGLIGVLIEAVKELDSKVGDK